MKLLTIFILLPLALFAEAGSKYKNSLVQVAITYQQPSFNSPWDTNNPGFRNAVGIIVRGNRILVPAHRIEYATLIEIKKFSSFQPVRAEVEIIDREANLALLKTEDGYFADLQAVGFPGKSALQKPADIYQLDNAGSVQKGSAAVLTMDMETSTLGHTELPSVEITSGEDLAGIGELVITDGAPAGMLARYSTAKNSGRMIPAFIINEFLKHSRANSPSIFPHKGFHFRALIHPAEKEYYGLKEDGVIVTSVIPGSGAWNKLQPGDVITEFGGIRLDAKGYFDHPDYGKQLISFIAHSRQSGYTAGAQLPVTLLRNRKKISTSITLNAFPESAIRIPWKNYLGQKPDYFVTGGFVFLEVSGFLLKEWGKNWRNNISKKLLFYHDYHKIAVSEKETGRFVVLGRVLPDDINKGYHEDMTYELVESVNGLPIKGLGDLAGKISKSRGKYIIITLDNNSEIVLDKKELKTADERIKNKYGI